jgi:hypothetical protein
VVLGQPKYLLRFSQERTNIQSRDREAFLPGSEDQLLSKNLLGLLYRDEQLKDRVKS